MSKHILIHVLSNNNEIQDILVNPNQIYMTKLIIDNKEQIVPVITLTNNYKVMDPFYFENKVR